MPYAPLWCFFTCTCASQRWCGAVAHVQPVGIMCRCVHSINRHRKQNATMRLHRRASSPVEPAAALPGAFTQSTVVVERHAARTEPVRARAVHIWVDFTNSVIVSSSEWNNSVGQHLRGLLVQDSWCIKPVNASTLIAHAPFWCTDVQYSVIGTRESYIDCGVGTLVWYDG